MKLRKSKVRKLKPSSGSARAGAESRLIRVAWTPIIGLSLWLAACSTGQSEPALSGTDSCPAPPLKVVVTTNVWGSVVDQAAGVCAEVATIVSSPTDDPHDFEPTAATSATFASADIAVINGLGYDAWAEKIIASLGAQAPNVVNLGQVVGLNVGANPHIWYSPAYVQQSAAAISAEFKRKSPAATANFTESARQFTTSLGPYLAKVEQLKSDYAGTQIGATESIFTYMAAATGLNLSTPLGFLNAQANGSDPSPSDIQIFRTQLSDGSDQVLVYNSQTDGALPQQLKVLADASGVPVVSITETLVPAGATFQAWQLAQLDELADALSKRRKSNGV